MQKWEYNVIPIFKPKLSDLKTSLAEHGEAGWELISVWDAETADNLRFMIFKRPLKEQTTPGFEADFGKG